MTSQSNGWVRVTRTHRCPECDGSDNCTVSTDGRVVWCGRVESDRMNAGGQWLHRIDDDGGARGHRPRVPQPPPPRPKSSGTGTKWRDIAIAGLRHPRLTEKRDELARHLGVSVTALERLKVGWSLSKCWTFPERDADGQIIGILRRWPDERKLQLAGSARGLTFAKDWAETKGPVYLVEGPSDTAALMTLGLCVIGRFNDKGGSELLAELLARHAMDRQLIVIGENDRKSHESLKPAVRERHSPECDGCSSCWPGKFGAIAIAEKLSQYLCREIDWSLPPDSAKDSREWLNLMTSGAGRG